jgi:hypothetical protein
MPKSDYASFDFYNYRSDALQAVAGFPVPNAVEPEAASSLEQASVIGAEALSQLITALYESAMDPQNWKVFLELLRSAPMATTPRSWCATLMVRMWAG